MTDVMPVEYPWLEMDLDTDGVTGNLKWVLSSGQTSPLLGSSNAVVLVFLANGNVNANPLDLTGTGWVKLAEHHTTMNSGNAKFQIIAADTDVVGISPEVPVAGVPGSIADYAARMVLVDNARVAGISTTSHPVTAPAGSKDIILPNPLPAGKQRRINTFFSWCNAMLSEEEVALQVAYRESNPGILRNVNPHTHSNNGWKTSWYVIPDLGGVFDSSEGYNHTIPFRYQINYTGMMVHSIGIAYSDPTPLCNDPAHVPVTITITAHGPVDVQVDPAA